MMGRKYPERVDYNEKPDATVENIERDDVIAHALSCGTRYGACGSCGEEQFFKCTPGHNKTDECKECGEEHRIVG